MLENVRCRVYNASYTPLSIVSGRRAFILCYVKEKATVLEQHPEYVINAGTSQYAVPTLIVLKEMVPSIANKPAKLTKSNLYARDNWTCQYCGRHWTELNHSTEFFNQDHVVPRDRNGKTEWTNLVTSCNRCNNKKANKTVAQSGLRLRRLPYVPKFFEIWQKSNSKHHKREVS